MYCTLSHISAFNFFIFTSIFPDGESRSVSCVHIAAPKRPQTPVGVSAGFLQSKRSPRAAFGTSPFCKIIICHTDTDTQRFFANFSQTLCSPSVLYDNPHLTIYTQAPRPFTAIYCRLCRIYTTIPALKSPIFQTIFGDPTESPLICL